jgi:hypothetical protein
MDHPSPFCDESKQGFCYGRSTYCVSPPGVEVTNCPNENQTDGLFLFLRDQASSLKHPLEDFYCFLQPKDVTSIAYFVDAINDNLFLSLMRSDWARGFKVETLLSAAIDAFRDESVALDVKTD